VHPGRTRARPNRVAGARALALLIAWIALLLVAWGLGALTVATTRTLDLHAVRDLASDRSATLTAAAHALSFIGSGYVVLPLAVVITVLLYLRGRRHDAWAIALGVAGAVVLSALVKILVDRSRPPVHHLEAVSSGSFPSGHATQSTAFLLAVLLAWLARAPRRRHPGAVAVAGLLVVAIAFSRVYLGVHYPTDVVAGILLGGAWVLLTRRWVCGPRGIRAPADAPPA
jgi:membrane-associated phospholipid phosphatase